MSAQYGKVDTILQNSDALQKLNVRFNGGTDEALDAYCAQLHWQDTNRGTPPALMTFDEMHDQFFHTSRNGLNCSLVRKDQVYP